MINNDELYWFAVYTRPRWEKKVAQLLEEKGIEYYCPLNKVTRQWSDRRKVVLEPVFKSYVFVRVSESKKWSIKKVNGVLNFVYWLGKPAMIPDNEIDTIRKFLNEFSGVLVEQYGAIPVNAKVRVKQGLLMNYHGILLEVSGNKARVRIDSMGLQLSAQFDKNNLEALPAFSQE
jgi:transcription antitermination factor NusG